MVTAASSGEVDVGTVLDDGPWRVSQRVILAILALAFVADGLANQAMAVAVPSIMRDLHVPRAAFSNVTALGLLGVTLGTILGGVAGDKIGRKLMLTISVLMFGCATLFIGLAGNINEIMLIRFLDGLGIGGAIPNAAALLAEFTPARRRSRAVNIGLLAIPVGILTCGAVGASALPTIGWRGMFLAIGGVSIVLAAFLALALPESPRFLVRIKRCEPRLRRVLLRLGVDCADRPLVDAAIARERPAMAELLGSGIGPTTIGLWGGFFFCFMAVYTALNWLPTLLSSHHYPVWATSLTLSAWSVGGICGSLLTAFMIERWGSRPTLIFLALGGIIGFAGLSVMPLRPEDGIAPVMIALSMQGVFMSGLTGCLYAVAAYIYPSHIKATGVGAAGAVGRSGAIVSSYAAVAAMNFAGSEGFFRMAGVLTLISLICLLAVKHTIPSNREIDAGKAAA